jgi:hypothetical protein
MSYLNLASPISDTIASILFSHQHPFQPVSLSTPLTDAVVQAGYRRSEILLSVLCRSNTEISGQNLGRGGRFRIGSGFICEGLIGCANYITHMNEDPKTSKAKYTKFRIGIHIQNEEYEVPNCDSLHFENVKIHVLTASSYRYYLISFSHGSNLRNTHTSVA